MAQMELLSFYTPVAGDRCEVCLEFYKNDGLLAISYVLAYSLYLRMHSWWVCIFFLQPSSTNLRCDCGICLVSSLPQGFYVTFSKLPSSLMP